MAEPGIRSRRRRCCETILSLFVLVYIAGDAVYRESEVRLNPKLKALAYQTLSQVTEPDLERGQHIGEVISQCTFCHAEDWGGTLIADDIVVGRLHSSNLTGGKGGIANRYSDRDFVRAIRSGIGPGGENLWFMPSEHFVAMSDDDLAALIHYIRSLPKVDREHPERWAGPAMRLAVALDLAPELVPREPIARPGRAHAPDATDDARYGEYLVSVGICGTCHRSDLKGGRHPLAPPHEPVPPDLTRDGALANWSETDFIKTIRRGVTPTGRVLSARYMPWRRYAQLSDRELGAIYRYLANVSTAQLRDGVAHVEHERDVDETLVAVSSAGRTPRPNATPTAKLRDSAE